MGQVCIRTADSYLIRYFDMIARIGGFRTELTRVGGFLCVGHCEVHKYADTSYHTIHDNGKEEKYYPDAEKSTPQLAPTSTSCVEVFPAGYFLTRAKKDSMIPEHFLL